MKNIILYIIGIVLFCFILPIIFTEQFILIETTELSDSVEVNNNEEYKYPKNDKIKVFFMNENLINEIGLDEYLYGVVSAEMPANYEQEALKAQAIVARTYTLFKIENNSSKHGEAAICTDSKCCQAWISKEERLQKWEEDKKEEYWNKIVKAVDETKGKVIKYEGNLINAFFHSNSGGKTEVPINVWGGTEYPYLQVVETSGENNYSQYKSEVEFTKDELIKKLKNKYDGIELELNQIRIIERYDSGRIKTIRFGNIEISGVEARNVLELKSANFEYILEDNKIKFVVYGYGHGVGMSQTGADSLAKEGNDYNKIIEHFYMGVKIENY